MTTLTALPPAPQRSDPANFATLADAWVSALEDTFTPEMNLIIPEINALAVSADTDAGIATTQAGIATTQAGIATAKALEASNSATTALNAPGTSATSTSSLLVGAGTKTLTIQTGKSLVVGMSVKIAYTTTPTTWMLGDITAYDSGTGSLTVQVQSFTSSGTFANWTVSLSAPGGVTSVNGISGAVTGVVTLTDTQTLTNKTIIETVFALTGTTPALLMTNGSVQTWTLSGASTPTDSLTAGASIILVITPGAFTITWPSVVWTKQGGSGVAPTLFSAGKTTVVLWKINSTLYGSHLGDTV